MGHKTKLKKKFFLKRPIDHASVKDKDGKASLMAIFFFGKGIAVQFDSSSLLRVTLVRTPALAAVSIQERTFLVIRSSLSKAALLSPPSSLLSASLSSSQKLHPRGRHLKN